MSMGARRAAGERVGPFVLERYLASGGMGDVYVARSEESGERVAVKFLAHASPANLERFEREGRIASQLSHRHIVEGRGFGRAPDGAAWLAMELLEGIDLDEHLRVRGLTPLEAVQAAMQVCEALEYAHGRRIVHRDLKPQNVWVCAPVHAGEGSAPALRVKVLDFGIARLADERRMTGTGVIVGSWSYMSPEQARAEPDLDARSDLWSLGVLLYECLAGRLPFDAPTGPGTLYQILFEKAPELTTLAPWLPRELSALVHRALSRGREERPQSATAFRTALASIDPAALRAHDTPPRRASIVRSSSVEVSGDDRTFLATTGEEGNSQTVAHEGTTAGLTVENRLTCVVFLRGVREPRLVADVAHELQARLAPLPGDDQLVVFGTDRWNGDEPVRAVRLAAAVVGAVRGAGVATGRAVRGAAAVAGAAVDVAVALSKREGVTVDATTASIVRGRFTLTPRDDGTSFALVPRGPRISASIPPGEAGSSDAMVPLVGRDAELAVLSASAETALSELTVQGVAVIGAAGMGKSRLRQEAALAVVRADAEASPIVARCEAFRRDTPFAALTDALRDLVDESIVSAMAHAANDAADPRAALDRARSALETALRTLASRGAVVLAVDDAQWLDAPSQSALRWLVENAAEIPMALWLFGRPEARAVINAVLPSATVLELKPLAKGAAEKLLASIAPGAPEALLERAAGSPLFLEELGRLYARTGDAAAVELPPSVEGASLAQLDGLEPGEREYLKRAAVFGRTAWQESVSDLGGEPHAYDALRRLGQVVARPRSRFEGTREFTFRSTVMQEVAYGLWTDEQRARLHERAGEWLSARVGTAPEELARHWDLAGDSVRAAAAYTEAAERAVRASADATAALALSERALILVADPAVRFRALAVRDAALSASGDRARQLEGLIAMEMLAEDLGDEQRIEATWRWCYFARVTSEHDGARAAARKALELSVRTGNVRWASTIHNDLALILANEERFDDALREADQAQSFANVTGDEWYLARAAYTRAYLLAEQGRMAAAAEAFGAAARRFRVSGDQTRALQMESNMAIAALELGRVVEAGERLNRVIEESRVGTTPRVVIARQNRATLRRVDANFDGCAADLDFVEAAAKRMGHRRLSGAVAVELIFLAMASERHRPAQGALAAWVSSQIAVAEDSRAPSLELSAHAAAARLLHRAGFESTANAAKVRGASALAMQKPFAALEVAACLYELEPSNVLHLDAGRAALRALIERVDSPADEIALTRFIARRLMLDPSFTS